MITSLLDAARQAARSVFGSQVATANAAAALSQLHAIALEGEALAETWARRSKRSIAA